MAYSSAPVSFFGAGFWSAFFSGSAWAGVNPNPMRHAPSSVHAHNKIIFCIFITFKCNTYFVSLTAIISQSIQTGSAVFGISKPFFAIQNSQRQRESKENRKNICRGGGTTEQVNCPARGRGAMQTIAAADDAARPVGQSVKTDSSEVQHDTPGDQNLI